MEKDEKLRRINAIQWYHAIEIEPGIVTPGRYDPRPALEMMGFPKNLTGKTVLDIGAYDGFFTFEAEKRGAKRVVALDRHRADHMGFAVAHDLLKSNAEYLSGSVYDLSPETHGVFDIVLLAGVLYHLRHPLLALEKIHGVCRELALIESHVLDKAFVTDTGYMPLADVNPLLVSQPIMQFYPANELDHDYSNWWAPNIQCLLWMIETTGFRAEFAGQRGHRAAFRAYRLDFSPPHWY